MGAISVSTTLIMYTTTIRGIILGIASLGDWPKQAHLHSRRDGQKAYIFRPQGNTLGGNDDPSEPPMAILPSGSCIGKCNEAMSGNWEALFGFPRQGPHPH